MGYRCLVLTYVRLDCRRTPKHKETRFPCELLGKTSGSIVTGHRPLVISRESDWTLLTPTIHSLVKINVTDPARLWQFYFRLCFLYVVVVETKLVRLCSADKSQLCVREASLVVNQLMSVIRHNFAHHRSKLLLNKVQKHKWICREIKAIRLTLWFISPLFSFPLPLLFCGEPRQKLWGFIGIKPKHFNQ